MISFTWGHLSSLKKNRHPEQLQGAFWKEQRRWGQRGASQGVTPVSCALGGLPNPPDSKTPTGILCRTFFCGLKALCYQYYYWKKAKFLPPLGLLAGGCTQGAAARSGWHVFHARAILAPNWLFVSNPTSRVDRGEL